MNKINGGRLAEFQDLMARNGLDGYVVTRTVDMGFLTGFPLDGYVLLVGKKSAWVFMRELLVEQFRSVNSECCAQASTNFRQSVVEQAQKAGLSKVGFNPDAESYSAGVFWKKNKFQPVPGLVNALRIAKKGEEVKNLRKACKIAIKTFDIIRPRITVGRTEISVSREIENIMRDMGATRNSFDLIVAFGPNGALPHYVTGGRKLKKDDTVLLDFGCVYNGYCSDISRTFGVGKQTELFRRVYDIVDQSQKAGVKAVRPGVSCAGVDKVCRDIITQHGYGDKFIHGTGHGVGLEIHEAPTVSALSKETLAPGMSVTVEPGIYLPGKLGVRIEDTVLVTESGFEVLTK